MKEGQVIYMINQPQIIGTITEVYRNIVTQINGHSRTTNISEWALIPRMLKISDDNIWEDKHPRVSKFKSTGEIGTYVCKSKEDAIWPEGFYAAYDDGKRVYHVQIPETIKNLTYA